MGVVVPGLQTVADYCLQKTNALTSVKEAYRHASGVGGARTLIYEADQLRPFN